MVRAMPSADPVTEAANLCREFAASPIATPDERAEHLAAAAALERLTGPERAERAEGLRLMLADD